MSKLSLPPKLSKRNAPYDVTRMESKIIAVIEQGCSFEGNLTLNGPATIAGNVQGTIFSNQVLVISEQAIINADIQGEVILIYGTVKGNVKATGRVEIKRPARFEGSIIAPGLIVEEGVIFHGTTKMKDSATDSIFSS